MKCPRCRMAVDSDEVQCSVCGELLKTGPEKRRSNIGDASENAASEVNQQVPAAPKMELTPGMIKLGVIWMVCCAIFSLVAIGFAFHEFSTEAMWASFIAAGLAGLPILYVILGRTVEVAYWYRKELMIMCGLAGGVFCIYLLAKAITKSDIHVETAGMQEMVTNENFTKTLITGIICISLILVMIPVARMLLKSSTIKTFTNRYEIDSKQDQQTRTSENVTSLELRRLELSHETELQRLDLERQRIQIEADRVNLLTHESKLMLTAQTSGPANPSPYAQPPAGGPPPPPPPQPNGYPPAQPYPGQGAYPQQPYAPQPGYPPPGYPSGGYPQQGPGQAQPQYPQQAPGQQYPQPPAQPGQQQYPAGNYPQQPWPQPPYPPQQQQPPHNGYPPPPAQP